ncbi:ATP-binding protein [Succinimonas amylolytica]|uniref:ATP-binding protein n=1 Tax=Succinimonas amylolytica TaxID=83769 RepID=UPI0023A8148B
MNKVAEKDKSENIISSFITNFDFRDISRDYDSAIFPQKKVPETECNFYRIDKLAYDGDQVNREIFHAAFNSLRTKEFNLIYIIDGKPDGVSFYIGCARNSDNDSSANGLYASDYANNIRQVLEGHITGSEISEIEEQELSDLMKPSSPLKKFGILSGIPSESDVNEKNHPLGVEQLVNAMCGDYWRMIIVAERAADADVIDYQNEVYRLYQEIDLQSKVNVNRSQADNNSSSHSEDYHENDGISETGGSSFNRQLNDDDSKGTNKSKTKNFGKSTGHSDSTSRGSTKTTSLSLELRNKKAEEIKKFIDEYLLPKLQLAAAKGFFKTSVYCMAANLRVWKKLENNITSIFQSERSGFTPLNLHEQELARNFDFSAALGSHNIFCSRIAGDLNAQLNCLLKRRCLNSGGNILYSSLFTIDELALIAALPVHEVPGLDVISNVSFGLNFSNQRSLDCGSTENFGDDDGCYIGDLVHNGAKTQNRFVLSPQLYSKHIFVSGVTGSGKTTTCQTLLRSADCNFLVIEPAKTEYRSLMNIREFSDLVIFTVGNDAVAPFCINPFEVVEGENFTAHIDMLKATMVSSTPMEGSMPQIIEEAVYLCYENKGWNTVTGVNDDGNSDFPTLEDFVKALIAVVKSKRFSDRLAMDYEGTLVSRFSNLLVGAKGRIFNCRKSNFGTLIDHKVVIEIENLKSPEDKCLLMGFILSHVAEEVRRRHSASRNFRHITLIEEAHKLLSKVEYGDPGSKKQAVEVFSDLLAEIRKYGEGYIIVDQIPSKLTPEILKNTNSKFIHRLFAADDKEMVGSTMSMTDEQKEFLSLLNVGECVAFSENMTKPVLLKIRQISDTSNNEIEDSVIAERYRRAYPEDYICRQIRNEFTGRIRKQLKNLDPTKNEEFRASLKVLEGVAEEIKNKIQNCGGVMINQGFVFNQNRDITIKELFEKAVDSIAEILLGKYRMNKGHSEEDVLKVFSIVRNLICGKEPDKQRDLADIKGYAKFF